jgi:hypothetical protein
VRDENCVNSSSDRCFLGAVHQKQRQKVRGSDETVDIGSEAFANVTDSPRLLLQRLESPARPAVDVAGLCARGTRSTGCDGLEVTRAVSGR